MGNCSWAVSENTVGITLASVSALDHKLDVFSALDFHIRCHLFSNLATLLIMSLIRECGRENVAAVALVHVKIMNR